MRLFAQRGRVASGAYECGSGVFLQDVFARPWRAFARGCCCNRQTIAMMAARGFEVDLSESVWRGMPGIVKPLVLGCASYANGNRPHRS